MPSIIPSSPPPSEIPSSPPSDSQGLKHPNLPISTNLEGYLRSTQQDSERVRQLIQDLGEIIPKKPKN